MRPWRLIGVATAIAFWSLPYAQAQTGQPLPSPVPQAGTACPPDLRTDRALPNETTGSPPLSEQLSQSKGVICPPTGVDPGLVTTPPAGGRMPVIPPPGTPGGDPTIQPK
jgi:hypothetical protein